MSDKLRVGFIGGGWVSCNRHMPAARAQPDMELVGLVTTDRNLQQIARSNLETRFGLKHFSASVEDSWFKDGVDAAIIGTPPDTHYAVALQALRLGKHVLIEKPFTMSVREADELIAVAQAAHVKLALVHNLQYSQAMSAAKHLLRSGALGELRGVVGFQSSNHQRRLPRWYKTLPLGLFTDESPHLIYLMHALLDDAEVKNIFVGPPLAANDNTPHLVSLQFMEGSNRAGTLHMAFVGTLSEWHLVLMGSKQVVVVDFFRDLMVPLPDDRGHKSLDVLRTTLSGVSAHLLGVARSGIGHLTHRIDYGNNEVFRRFGAGALRDEPLTGITAADGRWVVDVLEKVNASAAYHL